MEDQLTSKDQTSQNPLPPQEEPDGQFEQKEVGGLTPDEQAFCLERAQHIQRLLAEMFGGLR